MMRSGNKLAQRFRQWLLPLLLSLALVVSVSMPVPTAAHDHNQVQNVAVAIAMSGHDMPSKASGADHKLHPPCNPGAGCLAFNLVEPPPKTLRPSVRSAEMRALPVLTANSTIPPLPPPISSIVA